jgi:hypothetical protein
MESRKIRVKSARNKKILIGVLFLSIIISSGVGISFADTDINGKMTKWFTDRGTESYQTIENAISNEKEDQKIRLKEELELEFNKSRENLRQFTESEKNERVQQLRNYTDKLISGIHFDNQDEMSSVRAQLESILEKATGEMNQVNAQPSEKTEDPPQDEMKPKEPVEPPVEEKASSPVQEETKIHDKEKTNTSTEG